MHRDAVQHLTVANVDRRFLVHRPPSVVAGERLPAVVMLHGAGATPRWTLQETGWDKIADRERFIVVLPEALPLDPTRPSHFRRNPLAWNDQSGQWQHARANDLGFLGRLIDLLQVDYPVDAGQIFLAGFSSGASMAFRLATVLGDRIAALGPVAGLCRQRPGRLPAPMPTLYLLSEDDPLVPWNGGDVQSPWGTFRQTLTVPQSIERWAVALDCPTQPEAVAEQTGVRVEVFPSQANRAPYWVYVIGGLGHHWPGGKGQWKERLAGPLSHRINATEVLWEFFRQATASHRGVEIPHAFPAL